MIATFLRLSYYRKIRLQGRKQACQFDNRRLQSLDFPWKNNISKKSFRMEKCDDRIETTVLGKRDPICAFRVLLYPELDFSGRRKKDQAQSLNSCLHEFVIHLIYQEEYSTIALQTNAYFNGGVTMANGLLQLRIDDNLRKEASDVYSQLGLDLPTAIRMFLTRSVQVRGIPFSMILPEENYKATAAVVAMKRMSSDAENAGVADMTLDEINAEIEAVRNGK